MNSQTFEKARAFMYRNARPLDLARFQYHFENGTKENVVRVLSYYQNEDGGCGHAVEADCWNPNSTPVHSNAAGDIIREIDFDDATHPFIQGLLRYYGSGKEFNGKSWNLLVASNNSYPHAPWWHTDSISSSHTDYNSTASIAGFIICFANRNSDVFRLGVRVANEAIEALGQEEIRDMHTCICYLRMLEYIERAKATELIPYDELKVRLHEAVNKVLERDTTKWGTYTCKPSHFMMSKNSEYYADNKELVDFECKFIIDTQLEDGSWDIPWNWEDFPDEWAISRNWWKGTVIIQNLLFLKGVEML